jgi:hypothetical protein
VDGFVHLPIYVLSESGRVYKMVTEAYVISEMSVPILLGEDFQQLFSVDIIRNIEDGTRLRIKSVNKEIRASPVDQDYEAPAMHCRADYRQFFVQAKVPRRLEA